MDVAAVSTQMNMANTQVSTDVALAKKAMDVTEVQAAGLIDMLKTAVPSFGHRLDIRV